MCVQTRWFLIEKPSFNNLSDLLECSGKKGGPLTIVQAYNCPGLKVPQPVCDGLVKSDLIIKWNLSKCKFATPDPVKHHFDKRVPTTLALGPQWVCCPHPDSHHCLKLSDFDLLTCSWRELN